MALILLPFSFVLEAKYRRRGTLTAPKEHQHLRRRIFKGEREGAIRSRRKARNAYRGKGKEESEALNVIRS